MKRSDKYEHKKKSYGAKFYVLLTLLAAAVFLTVHLIIGHYFNQTTAAKEDLGAKVVITLPNGKKVYTYENLLVEEDGKLLYKGERNTIDLTGGVVVYEDWKE
ncbi:hypothetical protein [Niallia sp. 03133]|uniref:hypothetical protein n=1 Tax=Niallia sp. 03133 TaxID=3458060 RepID=UPI0040445EFC